MQGMFSAVPSKPKATRTRRKAVSPAPEVDDDAENAVVDFEVVIHSVPLAKKGTARKAKSKKVEPKPYGPLEANTKITWPAFLDMLAHLLETQAAFLVVSSFMWRWLKPTNSSFLPMASEAGFKSLIRQIRSPPKGVSGAYIIIKMDQPVKPPAGGQMPWATQQARSGPSSASDHFGSFFPSGDADSDDEAPDNATVVLLMTVLRRKMDKISEKYPPGTCAEHPDIECFHSRVNNLHFELDRTKKIIWAAAIKNGTATLMTVPSGSQHFNVKSSLTIRKAVTSGAPEPSVSQHTLGAPVHPFAPQYPFYPSPYDYPPAPPMGHPPPFSPYPPPQDFYHHSRMPSWQETPSRSRRQRSFDGSSPPQISKRKRPDPDPPSSPGVEGGSVDEFCTTYSDVLPLETRGFLLDLGFQIGEDLSLITEPRWQAAGFVLFSWNRVVKAYGKYKRSLRG
ncbi:hypothetical protein B0H17DRAFT_1190411 [Mycena rosella]|uniref:Uncharacterized protein n=1 Tax=Mycena rosella TaxID=1033263 RepID=A0AAD7H325_MYCRO|nr:hypothetical protein B0H17DRAFT_1190411 [Mycena rosella]